MITMGYFFKEHSTIIAGTGTSLFGLLPIRMPDNVNFISQIIFMYISMNISLTFV